ncbi:MAG: hypothetical protein ACRC28_17580 [Clostridium sp.]|uniref:hypothetical protein n=1 Tax=Clostridium sp. TaxID=1506 RepID=UPI003F3DBF0F
MENINKRERKRVFSESRKLILDDKLGFFLKIGLFLICLFAVNIIAVAIGEKLSIILGILFSVIISVLVNGLFNKFLLVSEKEGIATSIHKSNIGVKAYINLLVWKIINNLIVLAPIIIAGMDIVKDTLEIRNVRIYLEQVKNTVLISVVLVIVISLLINMIFLPVEYLIIEEKEKNIFKAIARSFNISKKKIGSTIIVLVVVNIQVYLIGIIAFWGYRRSGFGIIALIAILFVVVALAGYLRLVKIKWYKTLIRLGKNREQ